MRTTITHGNSESLRVSDSDVEAQLTRWLQQRESHEVSGADGNSAEALDLGNELRWVNHTTCDKISF